MFELNKIEGFAIVTGGARGLGAAMSEELASEGYNVLINHVSEGSRAKAEALAEKLEKEYGVKAITFKGDVADYDTCKAMVQAGVDAFGDKIAVLINNAGIQSNQTFEAMDPAHYQQLIGIELLGSMHMTHLVLPYMQKVNAGCIISMSSICGLYGQDTQADYSAAKAGLIGFSRAIARENAARHNRVNCIAPALMKTDMVAGLPEDIVEQFRLGIPMQMLGEPKDIAQAMAYIVNAPYLTGQVISPNGGSAMY